MLLAIPQPQLTWGLLGFALLVALLAALFVWWDSTHPPRPKGDGK